MIIESFHRITSKDLLQQAYSLFGRPQHGLDYDCFRRTLLRKFGLPFKEEQIRRLHAHYDKDGISKQALKGSEGERALLSC